jgi:hypothetical protein
MSLPQEQGDPACFRPPTRREHAIGAAVFLGFGLFFVVWFIIEAGNRIRWVILTLVVISMYRGLRHTWAALMMRKHE